jgi:hypothetical protein
MKMKAVLLTALLLPYMNFQQPLSQKLYVLAGGTWVTKTKKGFICERWQKINDTELRDQGFKVTGNDTTLVEEVQLIEKDGQAYYIPTVRNQNEGKQVPFKLTQVKGNQFTFSNPEHDYPQLIVYDFISTDSIHAWVDGKINGKPLKIDYNYKRMK